MTDSAQAGSVQPDAAAAGTPAQPPVNAENGSAVTTETPFSGLSEGTRNWVANKGYKSLEDVAMAGMSAEQKIGSMISVPTPDAPKEEQEKFYSRLGRPETPDKYEFKIPDNLPPDLPYDAELAKEFKNWAFAQGLTQAQAQGQHDKFVGYAAKHQQVLAEQENARLAAKGKRIEETKGLAEKEWGPKGSERFNKEFAAAQEYAEKFDLIPLFQEAGLILPDGIITDWRLLQAFAVAGESLRIDDKIPGQGGGASGENPFKRNAEGKMENVGAINSLIKSDPARAEQLCKAAGEPWSNWKPSQNPL